MFYSDRSSGTILWPKYPTLFTSDTDALSAFLVNLRLCEDFPGTFDGLTTNPASLKTQHANVSLHVIDCDLHRNFIHTRCKITASNNSSINHLPLLIREWVLYFGRSQFDVILRAVPSTHSASALHWETWKDSRIILAPLQIKSESSEIVPSV